MFVFGVDVPLVELVIAAAVISIILMIEIIVVMILLMRQSKTQKRIAKQNEEVAKLLWEIKDKELSLRKFKK